jgi:hypothetical protein
MLTLYSGADDAIEAILKAKLQKAIEVGADLAREQCPVRTGRLKGSIATTQVTLYNGRVSGQVTADTPYAYQVEVLNHPYLATIGPAIEKSINA